MAEMQFSPAQERAITDRSGAVLVSAAAGSGKTRVLVERLMRRMTDPASPCDIDEFLIITFTKKAAAELRSRIAGALSAKLSEQPDNRHLARQLTRLSLARITTIDGFCSELVRDNAYELHISPDFRQIEGEETEELRRKVARELLEACYRDVAEDAEFRHLADTLGAGRSDGEIENALQQVYNSAQCHVFPDAWIEQCIRALDLSQYQDAGQTPWGARLIGAFSRFCDGKIRLLTGALQRAEAEPLVLQRYGPVLQQDIDQLKTLASIITWDSLHAVTPVFANLPTFRAPEQTDLQQSLKKLRDESKKALRAQLAEFSASSADVMAELGQTSRALMALFSLVRRFTAAYTREKRRLRVQDFGDLEHGAVTLLLHSDGTPKPLAKELSARFTEILLDEYQDTNEVQDRLFTAISRGGKNRFMVGDVKQAIYRFRLADPGIFLQKYESFAPAEDAEDGQPRKILLSRNYRSDEGILEAANAVFSACMSKDVGDLDYGEDERLRLGKPRPELPGPVVSLHVIDTKPAGSTGAAPDKDAIEAAYVAQRIKSLLDSRALIADGDTTRPVRPEDVVILLRSVSSTAQYYTSALRAVGLGCQSDRESSLFDAPEVETLVSLLQVVDNPRQDIPLAAVLLSPLFAMSADTLAQIRAEKRDGPLYDALLASEGPPARAFLEELLALRQQAEALELSAFLTLLCERLQLEELLAVQPDSVQKLQNLRDFLGLAAAFSEGGQKSLSLFLRRLETVRAEQRGAQASAGCVRMMSIHKSKGLEFPVVVLAGLSRKFNDQDYKNQVLLHPTLGAGCSVYDRASNYRYHSIAKRAIISKLRAESRAEEMRVLYVAMTRAESRLIMTWCGTGADRRLSNLAQRLTLPPEPLLAAEASCMGDWVLEAALLRTEAGALFAAGEKPAQTQVSEIPWNITYEVCTELPAQTQATLAETNPAEDAADPDGLLRMLRFTDPHTAATKIPAKITATQLKGRRLDEEVQAEAYQNPSGGAGRLRRPVFGEEQPLSATERGTATHLAMQYLDFAQTGSVTAIEGELRRLVREEYLTPQQAEAVSPQRLWKIFAGPVGEKIRSADRVIREFKFSILTDASLYDPAGRGEQMLLQGVTDCCLIRDGRLTVIDFKTDRVRPGEEAARAEHYRGQMDAYSLALSRIFALPVEEKLLYFFQTDTPVAID